MYMYGRNGQMNATVMTTPVTDKVTNQAVTPPLKLMTVIQKTMAVSKTSKVEVVTQTVKVRVLSCGKEFPNKRHSVIGL